MCALPSENNRKTIREWSATITHNGALVDVVTHPSLNSLLHLAASIEGDAQYSYIEYQVDAVGRTWGHKEALVLDVELQPFGDGSAVSPEVQTEFDNFFKLYKKGE